MCRTNHSRFPRSHEISRRIPRRGAGRENRRRDSLHGDKAVGLDGGLPRTDLLDRKVRNRFSSLRRLPRFTNPLIASLHDGAAFSLGTERLAFSADSYVVRPDDKIVINGPIAVHGIIMSVREGLEFETEIESDSRA